MLQLRPYQADLVTRIRNAYASRKKAPLVVLPTGGGKTIIFSHIAASVAARSKRATVLVHRIELLRQTSGALHKSGVDHSMINPQFTPDYRKQVQVASVQTLVKRLHHLKDSPDLIVIDEAHHATAGTWRKILEAFPQSLILGVTATPIRSDGTGLGSEAGGIFDELIVGPQIGELINLGYLVRPVVYAPAERIDLSGINIVRGDYDIKQVVDRIDKPKITGDAVAHYARLCPGAPAVAFCASIAHAEHVADEFRKAGFRAYSVDGSMDDDIRRRILNGLGNGQVDVVTSCDLISEGTDIPAIACAILLRPTQSTGLFIQQIGRALRVCAGKDRAIILDHVGNVLTHGMPDEDRQWSLDGEEKKKKGKKNEEPPVKVDMCPKCFACHAPAPVCPMCGFVHPVKTKETEVVEGTLSEITPEQAIQIKRMRAVEVARAKTLPELEAIARQRGYRPGWARHIYNSRQHRV